MRMSIRRGAGMLETGHTHPASPGYEYRFLEKETVLGIQPSDPDDFYAAAAPHPLARYDACAL